MNAKQRRIERRKLLRMGQELPTELIPHPPVIVPHDPLPSRYERRAMKQEAMVSEYRAEQQAKAEQAEQATAEDAKLLADLLAEPQPIILTMPPRFVPGQVVKLTTKDYGVRYLGLKVTILNQVDPTTWAVQSTKRKSPLVVAQEHLSEIENQKAA